jgi:hypothetical protein
VNSSCARVTPRAAATGGSRTAGKRSVSIPFPDPDTAPTIPACAAPGVASRAGPR